MVPYYSIYKIEFKLYREPDKEVMSQANELEVDWFTKDADEQEIVYLLSIGEYESCSCVSYQDKFVCKHFVAVPSIFDFKLAGYTIQSHFNIKMKRGRRKRAGSDYEKDWNYFYIYNIIICYFGIWCVLRHSKVYFYCFFNS